MANEATLSDSNNPWPGKLFTLSDPEGEGWDHAAGCKEHFDYQGKMIEPEVVLAIIRQDEEKVKALTGLENPKVFHTTEDDTLFIYYSDHGYGKMAFFLEACESGSVFDTLPSNLNIYAFTSANQTELAWCDYCPPNDVVNHKSIGVCMSMYYDNEYQLLWEQESTTITLGELFQKTHDEVAKYKNQEVSEWGALSMRDLPMTTFIGDKPIKTRHFAQRAASTTRVEKSEAPIHEAKWRAIRADSNANGAAFAELRELLSVRAKEEVEAMRLGAAVLGEKKMSEKLNVDTFEYDRECASEVFDALLSKCKHSLPFPATTRHLVHAVCEKGLHQNVEWSEICL